MGTVRRRSFLNRPGEPLLLTSDPIEYIRRFDDFVDESHLDPEQVLALPLIAIPLPVATNGEDGALQRWTKANPAFMWHPLMWLPQHLAIRYRYRTIDAAAGGTSEDYEVEPDSMWAIRVSLELVASGLYNPDDGSWLDVLAYYGIDIDDPIDFARVEQWLRGADDETLDTIDLTEIIVNQSNPEWAVQTASDLAAVLVPAEWSIIAQGLVGAIHDQVAAAGDDTERARATLVLLGQVAAQALHDVPADPETGEDLVDTIGALTEEASIEGTPLPLVTDALLEVLSQIAVDYQASVAVLGEQFAEVG